MKLLHPTLPCMDTKPTPTLDPTIDIPAWLSPPDPAQTKADIKAITEMTYLAFFEQVLDKLVEGIPVKRTIENDQRGIDQGKFMQWIHRDPKRKERYLKARELSCEVVFDEMLEIADAADSLEDAQRTAQRIAARKYYLAVCNRSRYAETKQIEQNVTVDIRKSMEMAEQRLVGYGRVIDSSLHLVEQDVDTDSPSPIVDGEESIE